MSFLKKLFGGGDSSSSQEVAAETEHEGYLIRAMPRAEGGQYRLYGVIEKQIGGETKAHTLIRADLFMSSDEAADATLRKAKQVIAEQGERLFSD